MSSGGVVTRFYFNKEQEFTEHCSAFYSANLGPILGCDLKFGKSYVEHQQQHQNSGKYHQKQHKDSALELTTPRSTVSRFIIQVPPVSILDQDAPTSTCSLMLCIWIHWISLDQSISLNPTVSQCDSSWTHPNLLWLELSHAASVRSWRQESPVWW